jgi:hypothetical protein
MLDPARATKRHCRIVVANRLLLVTERLFCTATLSIKMRLSRSELHSLLGLQHALRRLAQAEIGRGAVVIGDGAIVVELPRPASCGSVSWTKNNIRIASS